jgi:hypothetical protein
MLIDSIDDYKQSKLNVNPMNSLKSQNPSVPHTLLVLFGADFRSAIPQAVLFRTEVVGVAAATAVREGDASRRLGAVIPACQTSATWTVFGRKRTPN